jgi:hypothetical protein
MKWKRTSFTYVGGLYSTIKDSDVKVTDAQGFRIHEEEK